jgi:hypothetical protein
MTSAKALSFFLFHSLARAGAPAAIILPMHTHICGGDLYTRTPTRGLGMIFDRQLAGLWSAEIVQINRWAPAFSRDSRVTHDQGPRTPGFSLEYARTALYLFPVWLSGIFSCVNQGKRNSLWGSAQPGFSQIHIS